MLQTNITEENMAYLEFVGDNAENEGGKSSKFYEVTQDGSVLRLRWGKIGTDGQKSEKSFASEEAASKEMDKLIAEKVKKGYVQK
jgi:predicted DNA-binding WGR domain protein